MDEDRHLQKKLEKQRKPAAIIHFGHIVYANPAFLKLAGYGSYSDLDGLSLLDLTVGLTKIQLRDHLTLASQTSDKSKKQPTQKITLVKKNGKHCSATMSSQAVLYNGEKSILFALDVAKPLNNKGKFNRQHWKLYLAFGILLALVAVPNALLLNLKINNAPKVYLPPDAPAVVADDKLREKFPSDQGMVLLFEGVALYSDGFLQAMAGLTEALESNPRIDKVISVTNQDHISGTDDGFIVEPLIDVDSLDDLSPPERKQRILDDRFARRLLVAADGSAVALVIIPIAIDSSFTRMALEDEIIAEIKGKQLTGYLSAIAGQITTDVEQTRSLLRENMIFIPATVFIGLLMVWLLFRRLMAVIISGFVIGATVNSTIALYVLFNEPFNMISSILPPLVSALTIAALVHFFNALQYNSRRGFTGAERVVRALQEVRRPALYTALTTIAGFASLGLSTIPPIRVFGLFTAVGVGLIYLVTYHLVPIVFVFLDKSPWSKKDSNAGVLDFLVRILFHAGIRFPVITIVAIIIPLVIATPSLTNIVVETNLLEFFSPDHKTRLATEYIEKKLVGTSSLDIVFSTEEADGLTIPSNLVTIRNFQIWAEQQPEIDKSSSFADFVEEMNWGFHAEEDQYRTIPDSSDLISQYLFIYDGDDLHDFVDESYQTTHVGLNVNVHGANEISLLMDRISANLSESLDSDMQWSIAGSGRMFAEQEDLLVIGQVKSLIGAISIIFILMFMQWRSITDTLICMVPNLSPILLIFILMGTLGIWLDMATAMIASVAVGIAIDDTIHIYHGFNHRIRTGTSPLLALGRTYRQAGRAVVTTTVILCSQFLILVLCDFVPIAHFGLLTSVGLFTALIFDLLLLPAILVLIYIKPGPRANTVS